MFMFMFIVLTIGQLLMEQMFVEAVCDIQRKTPIWKKRTSFANYHRNYVVVNLGFSIGLSFLLATIFPAAGMLILASGVASTVLSRPFAKAQVAYINTKTKVQHTKAVASGHIGRAGVRCRQVNTQIHKVGHGLFCVAHPIKAGAQRIRRHKTRV